MADAVDIEPVRAALARLGLGAAGQLAPAQRARLVAPSARPRPATTGGCAATATPCWTIRHRRHARARAFVCGALAGLVGHAEIYVSGGAEHQGPDGGGPVALIVDRA